jgi:hypothetical protein
MKRINIYILLILSPSGSLVGELKLGQAASLYANEHEQSGVVLQSQKVYTEAETLSRQKLERREEDPVRSPDPGF